MSYEGETREKVKQLLKMAGVKEAPVDVRKIAKILGFDVVDFDFPDKTSGMIYIEGKIKSIGVNKHMNLNRQRFTIAHEIGHYLNGHYYADEEGSVFADKEFDYNNKSHLQEKEANRFAGELLMPKDFLKSDLDTFGLDIEKLKSKYQVSEQALWIRLTSLGFADKYSS